MPLDPFSALLDADIDVASPEVAPATGHGDKLNRALKILRAKLARLPFVTDVAGVDPTGASTNTAAFLALSAGWWLLPPGTYVFATGGTLPANVKLFSIGGILAPATGQTLTLGSGGRYVHDGTGIGGAGTVAQGSGAIITPGGGATGTLVAANNLSDVASASTARTNLGLGTAATAALTTLLLVANNLSDLGNASTARTNLGLANGTAGQFWSYNGTWARAGLVATPTKTAAYTAASFDYVPTDTTSAAFTVTLPASPADGDRVAVGDAAGAGSWSAHSLTIAPNTAQTINGSASSLVLSSAGAEVVLVYRASSANWNSRIFTRSAGLLAANNLSDLASAATARTNLGLGTAATVALTSLLQSANNLSDLGSISTARTNLGLGTSATVALTALLQAANNLSELASASTARTNLGLGTAATVALTTLLQAANNLSDLASASTARTNLGLGPFATVASAGTFSPFKLTDITTQTAAFTLSAATHSGCRIPCNLAAGFTVTVPSAATLGNGFGCEIINIGTSGTITLNGPGSTNVTLTAGQGSQVLVTAATLYASPANTLTAI
jgi:hypothetical protein